MSGRAPSQNGEFNGVGRWRRETGRPGVYAGAYPGQDEAEIRELRRLDREAWGRLAPESLDPPLPLWAIDDIEGYSAVTLDELGVMRDLELWGYDPFTEYEA